MRDVHVRPQLLFPLAWFDVFSTSVYLSSGLSEGERRLKLYYLMLRKELEMHLENVPEGVELDRCPSCIWPWLWRTSLGYFSHDDVDHSNMMKSGQQHEVDLSAKKFPATCEWQKRAWPRQCTLYLTLLHPPDWTTDKFTLWTQWKACWGSREMLGHIRKARSAFSLVGRQGWFRGWQLDAFNNCNDTAAFPENSGAWCSIHLCFLILKKTGGCRINSWTYAISGENGIFLSDAERADIGWKRWITSFPKKVSYSSHAFSCLEPSDLARLYDNQWLNDTIISDYLIYCLLELSEEKQSYTRAMDPLCWQYVVNGSVKDKLFTANVSGVFPGFVNVVDSVTLALQPTPQKRNRRPFQCRFVPTSAGESQSYLLANEPAQDPLGTPGNEFGGKDLEGVRQSGAECRRVLLRQCHQGMSTTSDTKNSNLNRRIPAATGFSSWTRGMGTRLWIFRLENDNCWRCSANKPHGLWNIHVSVHEVSHLRLAIPPMGPDAGPTHEENDGLGDAGWRD